MRGNPLRPLLALVAALGSASPADSRPRHDRRAARLLAAAADLRAVEREPARRVAALAALARMGARAVPYLVSRLGTRRTHEAIEAGNALAAIGKPALGPLRAAFPGHDAHGRRAVLGVLARLPDPGNRPLIEAALRDPDPVVVAAAAAAAGASREPDLLPALEEALARGVGEGGPGRGAPRALLLAVATLRRLAPGPRGRLDELLAGLADAPGPGIRRLVARARAAGGPAVRLELARGLASAPVPVIRAGLRALGDEAGRLPLPPEPGLLEALVPLRGHPERWVRVTAARALGPRGGGAPRRYPRGP